MSSINQNYNTYSVSLKGLRIQNEDCHNTIINIDGKDSSINNINLLSVYDGHGGKFVSQFLEKNMPSFFLDKRVEFPLTKKYVKMLYSFLQDNLKKKYSDKATHCGSTCLVVTQFNSKGQDYLNILNTGDSRCILCRDNFAIALTKDHKPDWPEEKRRLIKLGGKPYFDGEDWRIKDLSVSKAFGDIDAEPYLTCEPDIFRYKLDKEDKFIVLACDGLWDVMSNQEVVNFVLNECYGDLESCERVNKTNNIAKKLGEHALKKGSTDNLTIIVHFFK